MWIIKSTVWADFLPVHPGELQMLDEIVKNLDYLQILQFHFKLTARCLKLGHSWLFQRDNDHDHIKTTFGKDKAG